MQTIPILNLTLAGIPALIVVFILGKWSAGAKHSLAALARMVVQLLLIGYLLVSSSKPMSPGLSLPP